MTCEHVAENELVERYAAGRLDDDAVAAFEEHYLACARCQHELRLAASIRTAAAAAPAATARPRAPWRIWAAGSALAAAALAALLFWPAARRAELERLGGVAVPPVYLGVQVRAADSAADSIFRTAMDEYAAGQYARAADGLRAALDAGVEPADAEFFLGASLLQLGRNDDAAAAFARVLAAGDTPYRAEAAFYRAKSLLRTGDGDAALRALDAAISGGGVVGEHAEALADSVRATE